MSSLGYIFQGQQMQTVEYRNIHGPKKRRSFDAQEKMGQKNGPYFLDHAFRWPKTSGTKMGQSLDAHEKNGAKKMVQVSGTKKWANLAATSKHNIHGTKKRDKRY